MLVIVTVGAMVDAAPAGATATGYFYAPVLMAGSLSVPEANWKACQQLCASNVACAHFGYWPNGTCTQQSQDAKLYQSSCTGGPGCATAGVISGPRNLTDESSWPDLGAALSAGEFDTSIAAKEAASSGGGKGAWFLAILIILVVGGGAYAAYSMGLFDSILSGEDTDEERVEEDSDEERGRPLSENRAE